MLGSRGKKGQPGIYGNDLGAFFHEIDNPVAEKIVRTGSRNVVAPDNHAFRHFISGIIVALFQPLAGIEYAEISLDGINGGNSGTVAGIAGKGEHDVGAAESIGQQSGRARYSTPSGECDGSARLSGCPSGRSAGR